MHRIQKNYSHMYMNAKEIVSIVIKGYKNSVYVQTANKYTGCTWDRRNRKKLVEINIMTGETSVLKGHDAKRAIREYQGKLNRFFRSERRRERKNESRRNHIRVKKRD